MAEKIVKDSQCLVKDLVNDTISRQAAIDAVHKNYDVILDFTSDGQTISSSIEDILSELPSAQPEHLTDDDFETIRIHLSALKNELCNQRRWGEAEDYERLIDRFMSFASSRPEITEEQVREYCRKRCLSVVGNELLAKYINGCQDTISRQAVIDAYGDWYVEEGTEEGFIGTVKQLLEGFPSAQVRETCTDTCTDTISRQALCEYALNQKDKNITANDIMRFPSAQHESAKRTAEAAQNVSDSDLISRKAAIDAFDGVKVDEENCTEYDIGYNDGIDFAVSRLSVLPSAQSERKRGKWIPHEDEDGEHYGDKCSECGEWYVMPYGKTNYCPNCGADMREEKDERPD